MTPLEEAKDAIQDGGNNMIKWLHPADHEVFFSALDNPPPPTDALRKAYERAHRTTTVA